MDKLKMKTKSKVDINIETIGKLFPEIITEVIKGYDEKDNPIYEKAIDFDVLKQELSKVVVEGREERYQMNWPGKRKSILEANTPINKTLRPCREESVDFDTTKNLYIEGDNLDVLKLIRETYLNKVKIIYIDPPYNTGKDSFVYNDDFAMDYDEFSQRSDQYDEDGNMNYDIRKNNENNGRFHTDWLNMMYPRLKLARDLLSDDGIIFISIDNYEVDNLRKICNEIFGTYNFRNKIIIRRGAKNLQSQFDMIDSLNSGYEYILMFSKNKNTKFQKIYTKLDKKIEGTWNNHWRGTDRPTMRYKLFGIIPKRGQWRWAKERSYNAIKNYRKMLHDLSTVNPTQEQIDRWYEKESNGFNEKIDLLRLNKNGKPEHYIEPSDRKILNDLWYDMKPNGSSFIAELFEKNIFNNPKSINLMIRILKFITDKDDIVLDFFSGSATTAHAVMQLNAEDGGNRKFIMVQIPEPCNEKSEAYKAGYENICEIGKERIRRAGKKIKKEHPDTADKLDTGFRVLKVDSSNMKDVFYSPAEYRQDLLDNVKDNVKGDRSGEDLLFQVMLDLGELLSSDIEKVEIEGKTIFNVGQGDIIACFDEDITDSVVMEIAKMKPFYAVFRDSSLDSDAVAANFEQIFETYSPDTIRKVL
jgi:adenine-specific DNA-methyltransferase